ncbi:hypothetical protein KR032_007751, partial [Drosophila birchii]
TAKLNANAQEFVPQLKKLEVATDVADIDLQTTKPETEVFDERKPKCKLTLPWKGFPRKADKRKDSWIILFSHGKRFKDEALLGGKERLAVPKVEKTPKENVPVNSTAAKFMDIEEKRREKERKVAVEALKLVEQRRMRSALLPAAQNGENLEAPAARQPIVHLSRSPIRYTPDERIKVDRLRAAKKERIERVLREMHNEKTELENLKKLHLNKVPLAGGATKTGNSAATENKSVGTATRRYIPTTKEWDEQLRAKQQATNARPHVVKLRSAEIMKREDHKTNDIPRYRPPSQLLIGEKRKGNLTHSLPIPNWTPRRLSQTLPPLKNRLGNLVKRYSIEQLLLLEPQPEELEKPDLGEGLTRL